MASENTSQPTNGTTGAEIAYNLPEWMALSAFMALAWFNILQLYVSIYMTFKRRRGLYFWSLVVSGFGVILHSLGFLLKLFQIVTNDWITITLMTAGWWPMVTGQALVLYSRLHLVVKEQRILRAVLFMIIWNAITLHIPTTILTYGSSSDIWPQFLPGFDVMERLQITIFSLQEAIISAVYLWAAFRLLKPVYRRRTRSVMAQLIWINLLLVTMDVAMLAMEYLNNYAVETTLKSMIYAIKLVLEFAVLNQLMRIATSPSNHDIEAAVPAHERFDHHGEYTPSERSRRLSLPHLWKRPGFGNETRDDLPSPHEKLPELAKMLANGEAISPSDRPRHHSFATAASDPNRKAKRPSIVAENQKDRSASVVSTILNNPAAFAPQRRRVFDPFSVEALPPDSSRAIHSGHSRSTAAVPDPPTRPTSIHSVTSLAGGSLTHSIEDATALKLTEKKRERRHSRLSNVVPNIFTSHNFMKSTQSIAPDEKPDPDLLQSRRNSVSDLVISSDSPAGDIDDEKHSRNIQDVENEVVDTNAIFEKAREAEEHHDWLERLRRAE